MPKQSDNEYGMKQRAGLFLGPTAFLLFLPIPIPDGLADEAWAVAGVTLFMAIVIIKKNG
ncbi:MAG: hypothetical protein R6X10_17360 [Desulfobacterales bacterium]